MKSFQQHLHEAKGNFKNPNIDRSKPKLSSVKVKPLQWTRVYRAGRETGDIAGVWKTTNGRFTITQTKYTDFNKSNLKGWIWRYVLTDKLMETEFNGPLTLQAAKDMAQKDANFIGWER